MPRNHHLTDEDKATIAAEYAELYDSGMTATNIENVLAAKLGVSVRTIRLYRIRKITSGLNPDTSGDYEIPVDAEFVKGKSVLYDADGKIKLQWVKTDNKYNPEQFKAWAENMTAELPKALPTPATHNYEDLLTVIPLGDVHLGMHAWHRESGDDFDLKIAERDLCGAVDYLVKCTPKSKECLIINVGDMIHVDNNSGETTRGHNKLDVDTRWSKILLVAVKAMRQCISSALEHHEKVTVINAIGNHDDHSSIFLTIALANIYENEERIHIVDDPTYTHYYQFGNNLIGVHHGHTIKPDKLPLLMATERPKEWGESLNRVWYGGHFHTDILREFQGVRVETVRTLSARDAWAASMGYNSGRDMKAIIHHRQFGEVSRHIVSIDMLRSMQSE